MKLPDHIFSIVKAQHAANLTLANGDEQARRALQKKIVEAAVALHPTEGWGWKKAGSANPPSKDSIANNKLSPGHLLAWDCFDGTTRQPVQRESEVIDGQIFIEMGDAGPVDGGDGGHTIPALPDRAEFFAALQWLDALYREQLGRPNGVDLDGIAAHVFDVYLNSRLRGAAVQDAKSDVVRQINQILGRTNIHV